MRRATWITGRAWSDNDVKVVNDWESAYYTEFSGSSGKGPRPLVVSYDSSPVFEVIYADPPRDEAPTAAVVGDDTCYRQVEFVGISKGTQKPRRCRKMDRFYALTHLPGGHAGDDGGLPGQSEGTDG